MQKLYIILGDHLKTWLLILKSGSHLPKKKLFASMIVLQKMRKNAFYFILKTLFVPKIFKFLSSRLDFLGK